MNLLKDILASFLIMLTLPAAGQGITPDSYSDDFDKYYPENRYIRKNKIKFLTDSSEFHLPTNSYTKAYDTLGRLIGAFNYEIEKFDNPYIYRKKEDTLLRLKYRPNSQELYSLEKFVYNTQGQIVHYFICCDYYFNNKSFSVEIEDFYYDKNILQTRLRYYKEHIGNMSEDFTINKTTGMRLTDVKNYSYITLKNGNRMVVEQQNIGSREWRTSDTTLIDKHNKIIKHNSYAKMGSLGCPMGNNVNRVTEYKYTHNTLTIIDYTTYCVASVSDFKCLKYERMNEYKRLIVFDKRGKKIEEHSIYKGKKELVSRYFYRYYD